MAFVAWSSNTEPSSVSMTYLTTDVMTILAEPEPMVRLSFAHPGAGRLIWINGLRCAAGQKSPMVPLRMRSAAAMRLHSYRDESHSRHFDLIGGGGHPWSIDLVSATASGILVVGFACALIAHWVD